MVKKNGAIRICDFKTTVNQFLIAESYLPRVEEIFGNLSGGKYFTKLDISSAYLQLPLTESFREFLTINTHMGVVFFQFNRLPFRITSAPSIFQHKIATLFRAQLSVYLYGILVTGSRLDEHLKNL